MAEGVTAEWPIRGAGVGVYAGDVTTPTVPHPGRTWMAAFVVVVVSVALFAVGIIVDVAGLVNVPGAADLSGDPVVPTDSGTLLALLAVIAWGTVFWRRRQPFVVWGAGFVIAAIGMSYLLLLVGAVHVIRRYPDRLRTVAAVTVTTVVLFVVRESTTRWGTALPWILSSDMATAGEPRWAIASWVIALMSLGATASIVVAMMARARAEHSEERAEDVQHRAEALNEQMVRQAERERIARDMHDALAHRLSVVSLHAGALEAASSHDDSAEIARTVREQTHAALQDMRGLIGDLRSGPGESSPTSMRSIAALLADIRSTGANVFGMVVIEAPERASAQLDSAVYRITQEALTNAIKHAPGQAIDVHVSVTPESGARIRVVNALPPVQTWSPTAQATPGGGHGTVGIRERAESLGGEAWIGSHEGSHYVDVSLPWQERA